MSVAGLPRGSRQEVGQLPPIECTIPGCSKRFNNEKDMKRHKRDDPNHFYCKKCDVDCTDWEDLTQHKVALMSPFLDSRTKLIEMGKQPEHITCEFCGEDFKSFGGRRKHREQMHQADQSIECPAREQGCSLIFLKAAALISHLENGGCLYISASDFKAAVTQKHIVKELFAHHQTIQEKLAEYKAYTPGKEQGVIRDGTEDDDDDSDGGVTILDYEDEAQKSGQQPLEAESDLIDMRIPSSRVPVEDAKWPSLPTKGPSTLEQGLRAISIASNGPGSDHGSSVTSRRGGNKVYTESYPSLGSPSIGRSTPGYDDDTASEATTCATGLTGVLRKPNRGVAKTAWMTGRTSESLFQSTPTAKAGDWAAILKAVEEDALRSEKRNLLHCRFYDPYSPDYDPDIFFHTLFEKYCCPFPQCEDQTFDSPSDIATHFLNTHMKTDFNCTTCGKRFKAAAPLVAHMESVGKCQVQHSRGYKSLLDEITGGFLTAKLVPEPKVFKKGDALVEFGRPLTGVTNVLFNSKMPNTYAEH